MTVIEIIEAVVVGVLIIAHVVSNLYSARCSCKLCTTIRKVTGSEEIDQSHPDANASLYLDELQLIQKEVQDLMKVIKNAN